MVVAACQAWLQPSKFVLRAHLGDGQGDHSPMADAVKSDLPSAHRDVLEVVRQQIASGVQSLGDIVHRQLEGLQLLKQGYSKEDRSHQKEHNGAK